MAGTEETMDAGESHDSAPNAKKSGRTSLLDSGEDFEVLDEEDIDDDPPPLEDAGGGKGKNTDEAEEQNAEADPAPAGPGEEWLDVLGMWQKQDGNMAAEYSLHHCSNVERLSPATPSRTSSDFLEHGF